MLLQSTAVQSKILILTHGRFWVDVYRVNIAPNLAVGILTRVGLVAIPLRFRFAMILWDLSINRCFVNKLVLVRVGFGGCSSIELQFLTIVVLCAFGVNQSSFNKLNSAHSQFGAGIHRRKYFFRFAAMRLAQGGFD